MDDDAGPVNAAERAAPDLLRATRRFTSFRGFELLTWGVVSHTPIVAPVSRVVYALAAAASRASLTLYTSAMLPSGYRSDGQSFTP